MSQECPGYVLTCIIRFYELEQVLVRSHKQTATCTEAGLRRKEFGIFSIHKFKIIASYTHAHVDA